MSRHPIIPGIHTGGDAPEPSDPLTDRFRDAMSRLPAGVTVIAVREEDEVAAMTVSAFTSVSIDPPLVLACLGRNAAVLPYVRETERFTVSILGAGSRAAASRFSQQAPEDPSLFEDGDPAVRGAVAALVCTVEAIHPGGDHEIVVGRVERVMIGADQPGLVYHRRTYRDVE